jgi:hypothetical protein
MSNGPERIFKESAVAYFNVLSRHLPGVAEKNYEKPQSANPWGRDLETGPPDNEAGVPTTQP